MGRDFRRSLTPGGEYVLLEVAIDRYRVLNDRRDPCLYPAELFTTAAVLPDSWVVEGLDGDVYASPPTLPRMTWEPYHDGRPEARELLGRYLASIAEP